MEIRICMKKRLAREDYGKNSSLAFLENNYVIMAGKLPCPYSKNREGSR